MENKEIILINKNDRVICSIDESRELYSTLKEYLNAYGQKKEETDEAWLKNMLQKDLSNIHKPEEVDHICSEINEYLDNYRIQRNNFDIELSRGRSKEDVFADEIVKATKDMTTTETNSYMHELEDAVATANEELIKTITTKSGNINQNPQLDGFLAEDYHANSFNMNAAANGSRYRARVLKPDGSKYQKDSVDIEIYDIKTGDVVKSYQAKYYKDADSTSAAFDKGNYDDQVKLAPSDQADQIGADDCLTAPDGTKSNPLSKAKAKDKQNKAQDGKDISVDWNDYKTRDLAKRIYKQSVQASLIGAGVGTGIDVTSKLIMGEDVKFEDEAKIAVECGATAGATTAIAGALKVAAERGRIRVLPPGTPSEVCTCIAVTGVETVKTLQKLNNNECSVPEAIDELETTIASSACGFFASLKGMAQGKAVAILIGKALGTSFGPVGTFVGGLVGGFVGHLAGSNIGGAMVKTYHQIRDGIKDLCKYSRKAAGKIGASLANII